VRGLVFFTTAVLALDGVLLGLAAWWTGSRQLWLVALGAGVCAVGVAWSWRWYRRRLSDLSEAGHDLARDVRELAAATRQSPRE
jgi:hypothetical protein